MRKTARALIVSPAVLIVPALVLSISACGSDTSSTDTAASPPAVTTTVASPFKPAPSIGDMQRTYVGQIIDAVEQRGGSKDQAVAALVAAKAESGWMIGGWSSGKTRDIFGWEHSLRYGASDSSTAAPKATENFMTVAQAVTVDPSDPAAYALAVQRADPRWEEAGYRVKPSAADRPTAEEKYAQAVPDARAALAELRPIP